MKKMEASMDGNTVTRLFASAMLVGIVALAPVTGDQGTTLSPDQTYAKRAAGLSAPIVLAQGRCFNGRCY
jgi:hypothetical protein